MIFELKEEPGRCRWCGCTEFAACPNGCAWANRKQTLCTECEHIDKLMRSRKGRRDVAMFVAEEGVGRIH
jgi:hypothetical protein